MTAEIQRAGPFETVASAWECTMAGALWPAEKTGARRGLWVEVAAFEDSVPRGFGREDPAGHGNSSRALGGLHPYGFLRGAEVESPFSVCLFLALRQAL